MSESHYDWFCFEEGLYVCAGEMFIFKTEVSQNGEEVLIRNTSGLSVASGKVPRISYGLSRMTFQVVPITIQPRSQGLSISGFRPWTQVRHFNS